MYNLQTALDERLAALKNKKTKSEQLVKVNDTSKEYIEYSLKQAGILNKNGEMVNKVVIS